jgi:hypothetical protein
VITSAGEQYFIPRAEDGFWDLWDYICSAEYAYPDHFPAGLSRIADQVSALLSHLDYIKIVPFKVNDSSMRAYGIRVTSAQIESPVVYEFAREA